jgi:hypothetical protein
MNERILELMTEAGFDVEKIRMYPGGFPREDLIILEDFAKLIVEDVLEILADRKNYNKHLYTTWDLSRADGIMYELAESIQKRFGTTKNFKVIEHGTVGGKVSSE